MDWIDALKSEVSQLWAEARHYYTLNEPLYLSSELEDAANQRSHPEICSISEFMYCDE